MNTVLGILIFLVVLVVLALGFYALAQNNLFFTFVREDQVKIVMSGENFVKCIMASKEYVFLGAVEKGMKVLPPIEYEPGEASSVDQWDICKIIDAGEHEVNKSFLIEGLYWIGVPPFKSIFTYEQVETIYEQVGSEEGGEMRVVEKTYCHKYDYLPISENTFVLHVAEAETKEQMPMNVKFSETVQVVNPYKAAFRTRTWLRTLWDQLGPEMRIFVGKQAYDRLRSEDTSTDKIMAYLNDDTDTFIDATEIKRNEDGSEEEVTVKKLNLRGNLRDWVVKYGIRLHKSQIQRVDPAGERAEEFVKAGTQEYIEVRNAEAESKRIKIVAEAEAEQKRILADADKYRTEQYVKPFVELGGSADTLRTAEALEKTNITFLSIGGEGIKPAINVEKNKKADGGDSE